MTPAARAPAAEPVAAKAPRCTCTACPLVCDDILPADGRFDRACDVGRTRLADTGPAADEPAAWSDGLPVAPAVALAAAARQLAAARRVLVTGFGGATLEAVVRAFDIADVLGAAVDAGDAEADRPAGPTIARIGEPSGVSPAGRSPTRVISAVMTPAAVERAAFSVASAACAMARKRWSRLSSSVAEAERRSTSIVTALAMALIEVPPETTLTQCVVGGSRGMAR